MNNTADANGFFGMSDSGYSNVIGLCIGILVLITTITLASYFCTRSDRQQRQTAPASNDRGNNTGQNVINAGLDEATLMKYPKLLYSIKANDHHLSGGEKGSTISSCCSICLADYRGNDMLRLLPDCGHIFHLKCVDPWLRSHSTCPICRTSPLPTPLPTPLAEVVPHATNVQNG